MKRDWTEARAKVDAERKCRGCGESAGRLHGRGRRLEAAHLLPRAFENRHAVDGKVVVDPRMIVPLCGPATSKSCHQDFDLGTLDLLPRLSLEEQSAVVAEVGIVAALDRLTGAR